MTDFTNRPIKEGQKFALIKLFGKNERGCRLWMLSKMLGKQIESTSELLIKDWQVIRNKAYPNWSNDDWEVSEEFKSACYKLKFQYEKEVLGQKVLFE